MRERDSQIFYSIHYFLEFVNEQIHKNVHLALNKAVSVCYHDIVNIKSDMFMLSTVLI